MGETTFWVERVQNEGNLDDMPYIERTARRSGHDPSAGLPSTLTREGLRREVQRWHGKPIQIELAPAGLGKDVTRLLLQTDARSWIFHAAGENDLLRRHVILHEYGHIYAWIVM